MTNVTVRFSSRVVNWFAPPPGAHDFLRVLRTASEQRDGREEEIERQEQANHDAPISPLVNSTLSLPLLFQEQTVGMYLVDRDVLSGLFAVLDAVIGQHEPHERESGEGGQIDR
jgi:hypothetical protein